MSDLTAIGDVQFGSIVEFENGDQAIVPAPSPAVTLAIQTGQFPHEAVGIIQRSPENIMMLGLAHLNTPVRVIRSGPASAAAIAAAATEEEE